MKHTNFPYPHFADFSRKRWFLFLALTIFIIAKLPHLFVSFYWDESWPYATAVNRIYHHGLSLLPNAIDPEYSRGHPLFFHFSAALWMHIFGTSHFSLHSFALLITVSLLVTVYEAGLKMFNERVAAIAVTIIMLQVMFYVQAAYLLPDMMVAFLSFLALYTYINSNNIAIKALTLTMLFLTKESGLYVGIVIGMDAFIALIFKKDRKRWVKNFIPVLVSVTTMGLFFIAQKYYNGWYIFPLYNNLIEKKWSMFYWHFRDALIMIFHFGHRYYYGGFVILLGLFCSIIRWDLRYLVLLLPAVIIYLMTSEAYWLILPSYLFFPLFIASVLFSAYILMSIQPSMGIAQKRYVYLILWCSISYLILSCCNFLLVRYLLPVLCFESFILAIYMDIVISHSKRYLIYPSFGVLLAFGYYAFAKDTTEPENLKAFDGLYIHERVIEYFEDHKLYNENISTGSFLHYVHLNDPYTGFITNNRTFKSSFIIDSNTTMVIFDNIEVNDPRYDTLRKGKTFHLRYRVTKGEKWAEIYGKVNR